VATTLWRIWSLGASPVTQALKQTAARSEAPQQALVRLIRLCRATAQSKTDDDDSDDNPKDKDQDDRFEHEAPHLCAG
jgi:hypothetical protein